LTIQLLNPHRFVLAHKLLLSRLPTQARPVATTKTSL